MGYYNHFIRAEFKQKNTAVISVSAVFFYKVYLTYDKTHFINYQGSLTFKVKRLSFIGLSSAE